MAAGPALQTKQQIQSVYRIKQISIVILTLKNYNILIHSFYDNALLLAKYRQK